MRRLLGVFAGVITLVLLPASVRAQAAITGVVKDASGAVLPGVSVEAAAAASSGALRRADLRCSFSCLRAFRASSFCRAVPSP